MAASGKVGRGSEANDKVGGVGGLGADSILGSIKMKVQEVLIITKKWQKNSWFLILKPRSRSLSTPSGRGSKCRMRSKPSGVRSRITLLKMVVNILRVWEVIIRTVPILMLIHLVLRI